MAQLKDTVVQGSLRVTDTTYTTNLNLSSGTASLIVKTDANKNLITGTLAASDIPNISATKITSDTLSADRIPNLSANKITSDTLGVDRIPNLSANKITSDTLGTDRIPNLSANKITSDTLNAARIPTLSITDKTSGTLTVGRGGTNLTSISLGGIIYAASTSAYGSTAAGTSGLYLKSNGTGAPTWATFSNSTVGLGNVTNDAQIPKSVFTEAYLLLYSTGNAAYTVLTANKSTTKKFLTMTGASASAGAAPAWSTIAAADVPSLDASKITSGTFAAARIPVLDIPLVTTYSNITNTGYLLFITQTDDTKPFSGHVRIYTYCPTNASVRLLIDLSFMCLDTVVRIYGMDCTLTPDNVTSGIYEVRGYIKKTTNNDTGGIDLTTQFSTAHTIEIYALELKNCTINSSLIASTYDSTKHNVKIIYTRQNKYFGAGLLGTADEATRSCGLYAGQAPRKNNATFPFAGKGLYGLDQNGCVQGISIPNSAATSSSTDLSTNRVYNTNGIDWRKSIYYALDGWRGVNVIIELNMTSYSNIDMRYTDNCAYSLSSDVHPLGMEAYKPVYLRGYIKEDGLFYIYPEEVTYNNTIYKKAWTLNIPTTEQNYQANQNSSIYPVVYIYLGFPYNAGTGSSYILSLSEYNPMYWYRNGYGFSLYNPERAYNNTQKMFYLTGIANNSGVPDKSYFDLLVYATTTPGQISTISHSFHDNLFTEKAYFTWNSTNGCLDLIFNT